MANPAAALGLGTTGIGDNFARARLMMAKQAGYIQSAPAPYSAPGVALASYKTVAPLLSQLARQRQVPGIPGLLRQGMMGRPAQQQAAPMMQQGMSPMQAPAANFNSTVAAHSVGNPFGSLGAPQAPLAWFNQPGAR